MIDLSNDTNNEEWSMQFYSVSEQPHWPPSLKPGSIAITYDLDLKTPSHKLIHAVQQFSQKIMQKQDSGENDILSAHFIHTFVVLGRVSDEKWQVAEATDKGGVVKKEINCDNPDQRQIYFFTPKDSRLCELIESNALIATQEAALPYDFIGSAWAVVGSTTAFNISSQRDLAYNVADLLLKRPLGQNNSHGFICSAFVTSIIQASLVMAELNGTWREKTGEEIASGLFTEMSREGSPLHNLLKNKTFFQTLPRFSLSYQVYQGIQDLSHSGRIFSTPLHSTVETVADDFSLSASSREDTSLVRSLSTEGCMGHLLGKGISQLNRMLTESFRPAAVSAPAASSSYSLPKIAGVFAGTVIIGAFAGAVTMASEG